MHTLARARCSHVLVSIITVLISAVVIIVTLFGMPCLHLSRRSPSGSRGAKRLPMDAGGSLAAAISSGRSTRARHTVPTPSSTAYAENGKRVYLPGFATNNRCARCYDLAERDGYMGWLHDDGRDNDSWVRKMPDGSHVPRSTWGCSICKVYLCKGCFRMEDEDGKPLADAFDHRAPTRGLMARSVVCE